MFTITKTKEEITKDEIKQINQISEIGLSILISNAQDSYNRFWFNEQVTPQEICDLLRNQAYILFENSYKTQMFIKSIKPEHDMLSIPDNVEVKINQDGTVNILPIE